jgi:hypothetical protein
MLDPIRTYLDPFSHDDTNRQEVIITISKPELTTHEKIAPSIVEECAKRLSPSSLEISFPQSYRNMPKRYGCQHRSAPQTMQKRTTNYVKTHHKTERNRARNINQKQKHNPKNKQKRSEASPKNFF